MYNNKFIINVPLILFIITIALACNREEPNNGLEFPQSVNLKGKERYLTDVYVKYPYRIRKQDGTVVLMDIHPIEAYGHIIEYPSLKFKEDFLQRGQGPSEYLSIENIRFDTKGRLWSLDSHKRKIAVYHLSKLSTPEKIITLDSSIIKPMDFDFADDSTIIVPDYSGVNRVCLVNLSGNVIKRLFRIPNSRTDKDKNLQNIPLAQAWRPFVSYNSENGILALVTQLGQVLELYDIPNSKVLKIISGKDNLPTYTSKNGNYAIPTNLMGYSDVLVGKNSIYAVYWGHTFDDIKKGKITNEGGKSIHVFNLDGTPRTQLKLDRNITGFHVDEENNRILAVDPNSDQPLVEYSFQSLN